MRKTKIVCTLGPATDDIEVMKQLVKEGMNVARFNFSHGSHEEHEKRLQMLNECRNNTESYVAALLDTKGPEIRLKKFENGKVELKKGQKFTLTTSNIMGTKDHVSVTYESLPEDLKVGTRVLIDDGLIELNVIDIVGNDISCNVINGGTISDNKGINVPDIDLSMPYLSDKDRSDIIFGVKHDFDFISASFVRCAADVMKIRDLLNENGGDNIHIVSKIENRQGVENIDEIIEVSDGIMIARGDLGVEIAGEEIPIVQKLIIKKGCRAGKQVITATQMLDSMMKNPRPTRAETTDVANAIYDGTSAIMLSGETAAGIYPIESLKTMVKIANRTEQDIDYRKRFFNQDRNENPDITDAISHATCTTALDLKAKTIVTVTKSGNTAKMISRYRPDCDIIGCSTSEKICRQLCLSWGVRPVLIMEKKAVLDLFSYAINESKEHRYVECGDVVVITAGVPLGQSGTTNMIKVEVVK